MIPVMTKEDREYCLQMITLFTTKLSYHDGLINEEQYAHFFSAVEKAYALGLQARKISERTGESLKEVMNKTMEMKR